MKRIWVLLLSLPVFAAGPVPGRYFIQLNTEPLAAHVARSAPQGGGRAALRSTEAQRHRARILTEQQQARTGVEALGGAVLGSVNTVANGLIVSLPEAQAAQLSQLPGVRQVFPVWRVKRMLDHALPLHKVPDAWNQVGYGNAGAGIKIAIIDSGINIGHPGFQDAGFTAPAGFPVAGNAADLAYTNNKVIVARSYAALFSARDPDPSAQDDDGHGSATAMTAAGVRNSGPLTTITGVAPQAWLGNYKIFGTPGVNDSPTYDVILSAIEDAVNDGMDVINLSLGTPVAPLPDNDPMVLALEQAASLGVVVSVSAGNAGPDPTTIASPATAPSVIAAGATSSDRQFAASVLVLGGGTYVAIPSSTAPGSGTVTGPLVDMAKLDGDGTACSALPAGSLTGGIALILRGGCFFQAKVTNAQNAGALGALVYTYQSSPAPTGMDVGTATLPAEMVSYSDGIAIKQQVGAGQQAALQFDLGPVWIDPNRIASFSGKGPNVNFAVKPDLLAVGTNVYTAAETTIPNGDVYSPTGYLSVDGTSFSAPLVAGAAALVKAARPGLNAAEYRSLLVNSGAPAYLTPGTSATVQQGGGGVLDVSAALRSTLAAAPVSLSFGVGGGDANLSRTLTLTNVGSAPETYLLSAQSDNGGPVPTLPSTLQLNAGAAASLPVAFTASGLQPGAYGGLIVAQGVASGVAAHIPYWYAVGPGSPQNLTVLLTDTTPPANRPSTDAILFRITDSAGVPITTVQPEVTVVSGGGTVTRVRSRDALYPGVWGVNVTYGRTPGSNVFHIQAGSLSRDATIITN